jgi:sialate O-acetylesterase
MRKLLSNSSLLLLIINNLIISQPSLKLPAIFSDNMVFQQSSAVPIWGKGEPNSEIKIFGSWGEIIESKIGEDSTWLLKIKTPKAGGPFVLSVSDGKTNIEFKNVLIGEVWLCSGQSNMEMPLEGWADNPIKDSEEEISHADNNQIRFFTVEKDISASPKYNCKGQWTECNKKTASVFSATAYFFGKKLYKELRVPIGLIHSSWGGTPAEAWTSKKYLSTLSEFSDELKKIDISIPIFKELNNWLKKFPILDMTQKNEENIWANLNFNDGECSSVELNDDSWNIMKLPTLWEQADLGEFDGAVWFRKNIELPKSWINKDLTIQLGPIDDFDITFVNGSKVGGIEEDGNYATKRIYSIPKDINNRENLLIAVRVNDTRGGGGIYGKADEMNLINIDDSSKISLAGDWRYLPVAEYKNMNYYVFGAKNEIFNSRPKLPIGFSSNTPTLLYNAMIAPLTPFKIKGTIWYQGEANTGNPKLYETLFPTMIKNWRNDFGDNFPFYFVQIAPYNYGPDTKSEFLRDAQRKTMNLEKTGMAVTLDIGDTNNIHPADKRDVGERLALWALAKDYGEDIVYSGPILKSMKINENKMELEFESSGTGLVINERKNQFIIAGDDKNFKHAETMVENNKVIVWSNEISNPKAVRYAWDNNAEATLFNKEGLPASSFRTDDWD